MAQLSMPSGIIMQPSPALAIAGSQALQAAAIQGQAAAAVAPQAFAAALASSRVVVIQGDSWFNYPVPFHTGIDAVLNQNYNYTFYRQRFSHAGDTLENMVLGPSWNDVQGAIAAAQPKAVLFSGGGNDFAGPQFVSYLNHIGLGQPPLRVDSFNIMLSESFEPCIRKLSADVAAVSPASKIFMHGYAHAIPDGRGISLPFVQLGPWLKPSFDAKGWSQLSDTQPAVAQAIDLYNDLLARLGNELPNFVYVDLRPVPTGPGDWDNELHLNNNGFARCAAIIDAKICSLVPGW